MRETIETGRLILRPPNLVDARRLGPMLRDPGVARMVSSTPLMQPDIGTEGYLLIQTARAHLDEGRLYSIDLAGEGAIGACSARRRAGGSLEIGYWLGRPYWGQGFATEMAASLTAALRQDGDDPIVAGHFADNPASGRVLEKVGFVYTGEVVQRFSLARRARAPTRMMRFGKNGEWQAPLLRIA